MLEPLPTFAGAAFQGKVLLEEAGKRLGAASAGNGFDESGYYCYVLSCLIFVFDCYALALIILARIPCGPTGYALIVKMWTNRRYGRERDNFFRILAPFTENRPSEH